MEEVLRIGRRSFDDTSLGRGVYLEWCDGGLVGKGIDTGVFIEVSIRKNLGVVDLHTIRVDTFVYKCRTNTVTGPTYTIRGQEGSRSYITPD